MNLQTELIDITKQAIQQRQEKKQREKETQQKQWDIAAQKLAKKRIKYLPEEMKKAAKNGESYIHLSVASGEINHIYLILLSDWAKTQNLRTKITYNNEPANEGGYNTIDLIISWEK